MEWWPKKEKASGAQTRSLHRGLLHTLTPRRINAPQEAPIQFVQQIRKPTTVAVHPKVHRVCSRSEDLPRLQQTRRLTASAADPETHRRHAPPEGGLWPAKRLTETACSW